MQTLNIIYLQTDIKWEDRKSNLEMLGRKINNIPEDTELIILPEMFDTGFSMEPERLTGDQEDRTLEWMKETAGFFNTALCGSTIAFENGCYYNRFYWIYPDGTALYYDKKHLFRMGREPQHYSAGTEKTIIEYHGWKILPLICYDLRFPVWSMNTVINEHPVFDLLIYVANWPDSRKDVWKTLLKARALENQSYCIGVNRVGKDGNNLQYSGDSIAFSPKGKPIIQSTPYIEDTAYFSLDKKELDKFRKKFPVNLDWDQFEIK